MNSLGEHYKRSGPDNHHLAFKFELKSGDLAISKGAYQDGLTFAESAISLATTVHDFEIVLMVLQRAQDDIIEAEIELNRSSASPRSGLQKTIFDSFSTRKHLAQLEYSEAATRLLELYAGLQFQVEAKLSAIDNAPADIVPLVSGTCDVRFNGVE